jgi:hypothetical protein
VLEGRKIPTMRKWIAPLFVASACLIAGCGGSTTPPEVAGSQRGVGALHISSSTTVPTTPSTVPGTPETPVTGPPLQVTPTTYLTYPTPYSPGYDTVAQLVDDSEEVVLGTIGSTGYTQRGRDGSPETFYNVEVQRVLSGPTIGDIAVGQNLVNAAGLSPSGTYIFFWSGPDVPDGTPYGGTCITGGTRGVMAYDSSTGTVTRLDGNSYSQIPRTQTFAQLQSEIQSELAVIAARPAVVESTPPACMPSATGMNSE